MDSVKVMLVDINDNQIGEMGKLEVHKKALLHRAISIFIFNSMGEWLLQRRALDKYHSGGLWTNTCCSHPFPGESNKQAAERRLLEEMGIESELKEIFSFTYREDLGNELTEYELDHVLFGISDEIPVSDKYEVMEWKFINYYNLNKDIKENPGNYTVWFKKIFELVNQYLSANLDFESGRYISHSPGFPGGNKYKLKGYPQ